MIKGKKKSDENLTSATDKLKEIFNDKAISNIEIGNNSSFEYERIKFGIPALDKLTGGGIPKRRMTLLYGATNVGKSYLASQIVANALKDKNAIAAWVDTEISYDKDWFETCGVDTARLLVHTPNSGEEAFDHIRSLMKHGVSIIVLDSIAGLVPASVSDENFGYNPMAWQARFVNSALPKLLPNIGKETAFVAINQVRSSMGPTALDAMPGGIGQTFFSHSILQVRRKDWIKEDNANVGFNIEVRLRKSKVGGDNWQSAIVPFRQEGGIDVIESFIREGIEKNLIIQTGAWYTYNENKYMGLHNLKEHFVNNKEDMEKLTNEVST